MKKQSPKIRLKKTTQITTRVLRYRIHHHHPIQTHRLPFLHPVPHLLASPHRLHRPLTLPHLAPNHPHLFLRSHLFNSATPPVPFRVALPTQIRKPHSTQLTASCLIRSLAPLVKGLLVPSSYPRCVRFLPPQSLFSGADIADTICHVHLQRLHARIFYYVPHDGSHTLLGRQEESCIRRWRRR